MQFWCFDHSKLIKTLYAYFYHQHLFKTTVEGVLDFHIYHYLKTKLIEKWVYEN